MLEISRVSKSFAERKALEEVSLILNEGECFGLLGPNGAGKTTLVNLISGYLTPDSGEISLFGRRGTSVARADKRFIGVVPQEIALYENLTVVDNLKYFGELYGLHGSSLKTRIEELLRWIQLSERRTEKVKFLSGGMKRRINLVAGLLHAPRLLLVDEPTVGIDPQARLFIYELIDNLKREGMTLLYTTHYIPEVERLCDRAAILNEGRMAAEGTIAEIAGHAGSGKRIEVTVDGEAARWALPLSEIFPGAKIETDGSQATVSGNLAGSRIPEIAGQMEQKGIPITGIRLNPAGLEEAFFHLTGKELRE